MMLSSQGALPRALTALLQCRAVATQSGDAAACLTTATQQALLMSLNRWQESMGFQRHPQQCSTLHCPDSSSASSGSSLLWSDWPASIAARALQKQQINSGLVGKTLQQIQWRGQQQGQQHMQMQLELHHHHPQQEQQPQQQMQQADALKVQFSVLQLFDNLTLQLPSSGEVAATQPLLCIKRTYQPHPRRYKRKHGFLKR